MFPHQIMGLFDMSLFYVCKRSKVLLPFWKLTLALSEVIPLRYPNGLTWQPIKLPCLRSAPMGCLCSDMYFLGFQSDSQVAIKLQVLVGFSLSDSMILFLQGQSVIPHEKKQWSENLLIRSLGLGISVGWDRWQRIWLVCLLVCVFVSSVQ